MSLGAALRELGQVLPQRVRVSSPPYGQPADITLIYDGRWDWSFYLAQVNERELPFVELLVRQEIEGRGWYYSQHCIPAEGTGAGRRYIAEIGAHSAEADSPAHALDLALLAALAPAEAQAQGAG